MNLTENTREAYTKWIARKQKTYFLTITFVDGTSDKLATDSFNHIIHRLNKKVHGPRYQKHHRHIEGFVVRERQDNGTLHFHCLLYEDSFELPKRDQMLSKIKDIWPRIINPNKPNKKLVDLKGCDFQSYYDSEKPQHLEWYITKTLGRRKYIPTELNDNVALLGVDNALFGLRAFDYGVH